MALDSKGGERNARKRSDELRRGRVAEARAANRMQAQATAGAFLRQDPGPDYSPEYVASGQRADHSGRKQRRGAVP
jgi:hypothetical protein